jgi:hypothetical protein
VLAFLALFWTTLVLSFLVSDGWHHPLDSGITLQCRLWYLTLVFDISSVIDAVLDRLTDTTYPFCPTLKASNVVMVTKAVASRCPSGWWPEGTLLWHHTMTTAVYLLHFARRYDIVPRAELSPSGVKTSQRWVREGLLKGGYTWWQPIGTLWRQLCIIMV